MDAHSFVVVRVRLGSSRLGGKNRLFDELISKLLAFRHLSLSANAASCRLVVVASPSLASRRFGERVAKFDVYFRLRFPDTMLHILR